MKTLLLVASMAFAIGACSSTNPQTCEVHSLSGAKSGYDGECAYLRWTSAEAGAKLARDRAESAHFDLLAAERQIVNLRQSIEGLVAEQEKLNTARATCQRELMMTRQSQAAARSEDRERASRCGRDYRQVRVGMDIERVLDCAGPFDIVQEGPSPTGTVTTYQQPGRAATVQARAGKVIEWYGPLQYDDP